MADESNKRPKRRSSEKSIPPGSDQPTPAAPLRAPRPPRAKAALRATPAAAPPEVPAPPPTRGMKPSARQGARESSVRAAKPGDGLRVLMVASEAQPFSKTGGLADVAGSLTRALGGLGHDVTLVTPRYRGVPGGPSRGTVGASVAGHWFEAAMFEAPLGDNARALLVDCPPLYDRGGIYAEPHRDYDDNPIRFAFLTIAALEWASWQASPPAVIHAHDWQAGLLPVYARTHFSRLWSAGDGLPPSVFTIHNIAYQGVID